MTMSDLVPIPWQPSYVLTPDTLTMLQLASAHAGHNILVSDAWRSYDEQKGYWDAYQRYLRGGPYAAIASNPDTGQRNHMRGAAVDIQNRADRDAMLAVGFTPDSDEWWHFNNPRWASMPIIKTYTATASSAASPIIITTPAPKRSLVMPDISIVLENGTNPPAQHAVGPRGRVHMDEYQADLLARWTQFLASGGDVSKAGGMSVSEMDKLIREVLSKVS